MVTTAGSHLRHFLGTQRSLRWVLAKKHSLQVDCKSAWMPRQLAHLRQCPGGVNMAWVRVHWSESWLEINFGEWRTPCSVLTTRDSSHGLWSSRKEWSQLIINQQGLRVATAQMSCQILWEEVRGPLLVQEHCQQMAGHVDGSVMRRKQQQLPCGSDPSWKVPDDTSTVVLCNWCKERSKSKSAHSETLSHSSGCFVSIQNVKHTEDILPKHTRISSLAKYVCNCWSSKAHLCCSSNFWWSSNSNSQFSARFGINHVGPYILHDVSRFVCESVDRMLPNWITHTKIYPNVARLPQVLSVVSHISWDALITCATASEFPSKSMMQVPKTSTSAFAHCPNGMSPQIQRLFELVGSKIDCKNNVTKVQWYFQASHKWVVPIIPSIYPTPCPTSLA